MIFIYIHTDESNVKYKNTDKIPDIPEKTSITDTNKTPEDQSSIDDSLQCQDQETNDISITEEANDTTSMDQRTNDMPPIDHKPTDTPSMDPSIKGTTVADQEDNGTPSIDQQVNDTLTMDQKADDMVTAVQKAKDADKKADDTQVSIDEEDDMFEVEVSPEETTKHLTLVRQYLIPRSDLTKSEGTTVVKWFNSDCSLQEFNLDFTTPEGKRKFGKYLSVCATLSKLRHPNIQQLWGFVSQEEDSTKPSASIVTEMLDLTLTELLTNHKCNEIQTATHISICYDVAKAVSYLHSSQVSHLFIRSDCILLTRDYRAKLGDIALSLLYKCGLNNEIKMINNYLPPDGMLPGASGAKVDSFSTGVLFLQIITHVAPNPVPSDELYRTEIQRRQDHIDLVHSSHPLLTLIITCLSNKPEDRPTDEEMCSILESSMRTQD